MNLSTNGAVVADTVMVGMGYDKSSRQEGKYNKTDAEQCGKKTLFRLSVHNSSPFINYLYAAVAFIKTIRAFSVKNRL